MKLSICLLLALVCFAAWPATSQAQVEVRVAVPTEPPVTVPAPLPGGVAVVNAPSRAVVVRTVEPAVAQRHLLVAPRAVVVSPPPAVPAPNAPTTTTTETTTVITTPGFPPRVYNHERRVVVVQEEGQARELPYVVVPVLFVEGSTDLLDAESAAAIEQMAQVVLQVNQTEPNAVFDVEGHTSTEGTAESNMALSAARAQRVHAELTQRYGVPARLLTAHGYGESFPSYPDGTEEQLQLDRRVLIVRTR